MRLPNVLPAFALLALAGPAFAQASDADQLKTRTGVVRVLESRFAGMDTNKDGIIDRTEAQAAQDRLQAEANANLLKEADAAFAELDKDHDGKLTQEEFRATAPKIKPSDGQQALISRFDTNKDGKVSLSEYEKPLLAQFDGFDKNKDGRISDAEAKGAQGR